ncbi:MULTISPECIES: hypothetical protein [unclassified Novosphingobium]|uniref:hypothetical protein n=1 Tax=Novosphingobium TaxID=165696 RepID=UPI0014453F13|nr:MULTISPECIES: hypothetical protein [unclassified Novosphingobium]NKJ41149.1 hypothetical protein [Novosphingobium sp. SG720]NMN03398.1 hypothetical protein [Novosphingobium sp. SG919]NMN86612.1 hypothetical protein [Novosphingobium sp. SG916]
MFLDLKDPWPPAPPNRQPASAPRLTPRRQRIVVLIVAVNLLFLLIGPLAGSSVVEGLAQLLH